MSAGLFQPPKPRNEPIRQYAPGSSDRAALESSIRELEASRIEIAMEIGGREVRTGTTRPIVIPHRRHHVLADAHQGGPAEVTAAIAAAQAAAPGWRELPWHERASIFLKAADLLAGPWRMTLNAATMLNQSKTIHQAEIDAACELIDFWRFNVDYVHTMLQGQPAASDGVWNRLDYRPLEGFVYAVSPFNATALLGYLPTTPALVGNTVVWKPSGATAFTAYWLMRLLEAAGLPPGVINVVYGNAAEIAKVALSSPDLAGVHFTGSSEVFQDMWSEIAGNLGRYRGYPRIVGETGGKDFIVAHRSADVDALATAVLRGAFEYQGQKCSAPSRLYIPSSLWPGLKARLIEDIASVTMGDVTSDLSAYMGAVIDQRAFDRQTTVLSGLGAAADGEVITGGQSADDEGWFIAPTLVATQNPSSRLLAEELFGPIVTAYIYEDAAYSSVLELVDRTSPYALTGAIFSEERAPIAQAESALRFAAGNFYINDKPTGAVVGQQPFGGGRASGTNDKAGSPWNLFRWVSPRAIKENHLPPKDYRYPYMGSSGGRPASAGGHGAVPGNRPVSSADADDGEQHREQRIGATKV